MASLYKDLVRAGIPTDHHESDLYVLDTPQARETIKSYGYTFTTFTSNLDGKRWIDVPFAYEPFWETKQKTRAGAPSGERTVEAATRRPGKGRAHATRQGVLHAGQSAAYEAGKFDGYKGRANRYASRRYLEESAWKAASKAERARQIRGGYTAKSHGLKLDPYGNAKMIRLQLAAPGTPDAYKRGYRAGTQER